MLAERAVSSRRPEDCRALLAAMEGPAGEALATDWRADWWAWALWRVGRRAEALAAQEALVERAPTVGRLTVLCRWQWRLGRWRAGWGSLKRAWAGGLAGLERGQAWDRRTRDAE